MNTEKELRNIVVKSEAEAFKKIVGMGTTDGFFVCMKKIAEKNKKSLLELAVLWKKYSGDCSDYNQSTTIPEFLRWNNLEDPVEWEKWTIQDVGAV